MPAYNLFRHRAKQELVCAVPEDCAVPAFIAEEAWEFDRKLTETAAAPMGFDASAAAVSVRFNGFYLFQSFGKLVPAQPALFRAAPSGSAA
jgi:hypothetical protein